MSMNSRAPAMVYACVLKNNTDAEVTVQVEFSGFEDHHHEVADIALGKGEEQRVDEKEFEHGEHQTKYRKGIDLVRVKKFDGTTVELKAPFNGVTAPTQQWVFEIDNAGIRSVNPEKH